MPHSPERWDRQPDLVLMRRPVREIADLRIALVSGNYNCVRDGANQALNSLVGYLLEHGAAVRVYSPTSDDPAFAAVGDLVSVPSVPMPFGCDEFSVAWRIPAKLRADIAAFDPTLFHISLPLLLGASALRLARRIGVPAVASMHTRFETYPGYYGFGFMERPLLAMLRRFYRHCDAVVAPCESAAQVMKDQGLADQVGIWSRGVDASIFNPGQRSEDFRARLGFEPDQLVVAFLGRLVLEKGLGEFALAVDCLRQSGLHCGVLVIGDGPARPWFERRLGEAVFLGHQQGASLGKALASADVLLNPSVTEAFGNVTLEAMACGLPVVAVAATGSSSLVLNDETGFLVAQGDLAGLNRALFRYGVDAELRRAHSAAGLRRSASFTWAAANAQMAATYLSVLNS